MAPPSFKDLERIEFGCVTILGVALSSFILPSAPSFLLNAFSGFLNVVFEAFLFLEIPFGSFSVCDVTLYSFLFSEGILRLLWIEAAQAYPFYSCCLCLESLHVYLYRLFGGLVLSHDS